MPTDRKLDKTISTWLEAEAPGQLPDRVLRATFERTRKVRQQGRWRALLARLHMKGFAMNKLVPIGLGAAAVVVVLVVGAQLLGSPAPGGVGAAPPSSPTPTAPPTPAPTPDATPLPTAEAGLPEGPFVVTGTDDPVQVTLDIASSGWVSFPIFDALSKDDDGLDPPETVGVALLAWAWPAGTAFNVYGDPCNWLTTIPEAPATTPDEIAAALAAQASRDASAPINVTVGGYAGKSVTLHVPMTFEVANATREEEFADCDQSLFGSYAVEGDTEPTRNHQGPGQVDELWILDVDGAIVILDAMYGPAVPAELIDELRALAESATFD